MTKDEIIEMAKQAGYNGPNIAVFTMQDLETFAKLVAEAEREACAKLCEDLSKDMTPIAEQAAKSCATLIRARTA
jgi:hypothetical protein